MRIITSAIIALVIALSGATAHAGGSSYDYVNKVNVGSDNYLYIAVPGNLSNTQCSRPYYARSLYPLSDARTKAMMQVALTSFVSKKSIYIWTNSSCTSYGYPIMSKLQLQQQ